MSNHPLPYSTSLLGYSLSAVSQVREHQGYGAPAHDPSPAAWSARLHEVRATFQVINKASTPSEAISQGCSTTLNAQEVGKPAHSHVLWQARQAGALRQPSKYSLTEKSTSTYLCSSKLRLPSTVLLTSVDLGSIAHSSTGGNGIARPPCQFVACRAGDGLAVYERHPTRTHTAQPPPTEHLVAQPDSSPTAESRPDAGGAPPAALADSSGTTETTPHQEASHSPVGSPIRNGRRQAGGRPGKARLSEWLRASQPDNSWGFSPPAFARPHTTGVLPAQSESTYWSAPAATFLSGVPHVPSSLRVDCGTSTEKSFLTAEKRAGQQHSTDGYGRPLDQLTTAQSSSPSAPFRSPYGNVFGRSCSPPRSPVSRVLSPGTNPDRLLQSHLDSHPEMKRQEKVLLDRQGLSSSQAARVVQGRSHIILEAVHAASRRSNIKQEPFSLATDQRRVTQLPPELGLPRRKSPGVGR